MKRVLINVGCGFTVGSSWENYDASPTVRFERLPLVGRIYTKNAIRFPESVRYGDITKAPLCGIGEADAIFCSHMLEHVPYAAMRDALANIYAMLKSGGVFRMIVPDLGVRVQNYAERRDKGEIDAATILMRNLGMGSESTSNSFLGRFGALLGNSRHHWMYDEQSMRAELEAVNFRSIRRCRFGDSKISEISEVEDESRYVSEVGKELAFECEK